MNSDITTQKTPSALEIDARWQNALSQFELWTQIWADNPALTKKAGSRVEELMMPIADVRERYALLWQRT